MLDAITYEVSCLTDRVTAYRFVLLLEGWGLNMDRLSEKLAKAGGVVARVSTKIEARADAIIAREDAIEARTDQVFSPHESILASAEKGLDGVEASLRLMSNGAPLEPSTASPAVMPSEPPASQQPGSTASTEPVT